MEVILKKVKITSSVLKQAQICSVHTMKTSNVLGWCIDSKNNKWIVLYNQFTFELTKYLMFREAIKEDDVSNSIFQVKVNIGGNYIAKRYGTSGVEEQEEIIKLLNTIKHQAQIKGQFFI